MYSKQKLLELGFVEDKDEVTGIVDFTKKVSENVFVVFTPILEELFLWIAKDDAVDKTQDGVKLPIDTSDLEQAIELAGIIVGVEEF